MKELTVKQRQYLKGLAHDLQPVVMVGNNGLTPSVVREISVNLEAHELIKVKVLGDDREFRKQLVDEICAQTQASFVQHIGKLIVLYKENEKAKISLPK
ncbi:MAG: ribosome assembly RNA-binding protein YhbY [Neisseriaceae bacterium]|jgi:RNA-binding protein|nr:MAG: ribosome assembly RNA-binding protein YhbY [Neisseriaceae bacterium]